MPPNGVNDMHTQVEEIQLRLEQGVGEQRGERFKRVDKPFSACIGSIDAGILGRDDTVREAGGDNRRVEHVRVSQDVPAADPFDDEVRDVLPSLGAAQRADPGVGTVIAYLEIAETDQAAPWMRERIPADPPHGTEPTAQTISTTTLLDIAATCFRRKCHSVRIPTESDDRGLLCVPRTLRLPLLTLYHERRQHSGRGRFTDALLAEYWWPTLATDSKSFVA